MTSLYKRLSKVSYILPAVIFLGIFFILPIIRLLAISFGFGTDQMSFDAYNRLFANSVFWTSLVTTLQVSALVTIFALLIGYPIAYSMAITKGRVQVLIGLGVLLPFWASVLVRNYSWIHLLRRKGALNETLMSLELINQPLALIFNMPGVVIGMTNTLLPFMILPIFVAIQSQDKLLNEAARSLGAGPVASFLTVSLPLSASGIYAGCGLVFATALGFFVTPALLGGGKLLMTATYISREIDTYLDWPLAAAASVILLVLVVAIMAIYTRIISIERLAGMGDPDA